MTMYNGHKIQVVVVFHENRRRCERSGKVKDPEATIKKFIADFEEAYKEFRGLAKYDYEVYDARGERIGECERIGPYTVYLKILTYMPFDPGQLGLTK